MLPSGNPLNLHKTALAWAGIGVAFGKITKVSPKLCGLILAISKIVDTILFYPCFIIVYKKKGGVKQHKIYAFTSTLVNSITLYVLLKNNLIGSKEKKLLIISLLIYFFYNYRAHPLNDFEAYYDYVSKNSNTFHSRHKRKRL